MKLIIAGATGFVGTELVRQSLRRQDITSVIALSRKPMTIPNTSPGASDKLKNVVLKDYDDYPNSVKEELSGAGACIWTVAITPSKSTMYDFAEVTRVCQTSALVGMQAMHDAGPEIGRPFRFLYMSGLTAERDQAKRPAYKPEYCLMRGETEVKLLELAQTLGFEACAAKPGLINAPGAILRTAFSWALKLTMGVPIISAAEISAAMLDQVVHGFDKEPLMNDDLAEIGSRSPSLQA